MPYSRFHYVSNIYTIHNIQQDLDESVCHNYLVYISYRSVPSLLKDNISHVSCVHSDVEVCMVTMEFGWGSLGSGGVRWCLSDVPSGSVGLRSFGHMGDRMAQVNGRGEQKQPIACLSRPGALNALGAARALGAMRTPAALYVPRAFVFLSVLGTKLNLVLSPVVMVRRLKWKINLGHDDDIHYAVNVGYKNVYYIILDS